jgi:hypothetical protein
MCASAGEASNTGYEALNSPGWTRTTNRRSPPTPISAPVPSTSSSCSTRSCVPDSKTRAEIYALALDPLQGWMTREEVRRLENLEPESTPRPTKELIPNG